MDFDSSYLWFSVSVVAVIADGLIGAWIGSQRGRGTSGFFLGFFLSFIGWIIAALLPREEEPVRQPSRPWGGVRQSDNLHRVCAFCGHAIPVGADACPACHEKV